MASDEQLYAKLDKVNANVTMGDAQLRMEPIADQSANSEREKQRQVERLQLYEAVCRNQPAVVDPELMEAMRLLYAVTNNEIEVDEATQMRLETLDAKLDHLLIELPNIVGIQPPRMPTAGGILNADDIVDLNALREARSDMHYYDNRLQEGLRALNASRMHQGLGSLPGCESDGVGSYICTVSPDVTPETYGPAIMDHHAQREAFKQVLNQHGKLETALDDALMRDVLNGHVAFAHPNDPDLCAPFYALKENGLLDALNPANVQFIPEAHGASHTNNASADASIMHGRGHLLHFRDDQLRLVFTGNSEEKFPQWSALVTAYNMKHPQQEPLAFTRENDGSYRIKGEPAMLREFAEHMHRGLAGLHAPAMAPDHPLASAAKENNVERSR